MAGVAITVTEVVALEVELAREIDGRLLQQMTRRLFPIDVDGQVPQKLESRLSTIVYIWILTVLMLIYLSISSTSVFFILPPTQLAASI